MDNGKSANNINGYNRVDGGGLYHSLRLSMEVDQEDYLIYGKSTHNFDGYHSIIVGGFCHSLCHSMEVVQQNLSFDFIQPKGI